MFFFDLKPSVYILFLLWAGGALFFVSCNQEAKEQDQLYKEVMKIHDDVMPKMGEINKISRELKALKDSIAVNPQDTLMIWKALQQLEAADKEMWDWMHGFKQKDAMQGKSHEEIMNYYTDQKIMITKVRDDMLGAIKDGNKLVESLPK